MAELPIATRRTGAPAAPRLDSRSPCLHEEMLRGQGPPGLRTRMKMVGSRACAYCMAVFPFWIPAFAG